jgi:hypothetical protein
MRGIGRRSSSVVLAICGILATQVSVEPPLASAASIVDHDKGFDASSAPSQTNMGQWWLYSPYFVVGIYVWGRERLDQTQANLTQSWAINEDPNWEYIPTVLDAQAPCTGYAVRISTSTSSAKAGGVWVADQAIAATNNLAFTPGILYYDFEPWDATNSSCNASVDAFVTGWVQELHAKGWKAGVYANPCGQNSDPVNWTKLGSNVPDDMWFPHYDGNPDPASEGGCISTGYWSLHQRIKQYVNTHSETWPVGSSHTISIDNDCIDARVHYQRTVGANDSGC